MKVTMESDEQVAVLSVNMLGVGREVDDPPWSDFTGLNNLSLNEQNSENNEDVENRENIENDGNGENVQSNENNKSMVSQNSEIEKDLAFLMDCTSNADPDFLYSVLQSEKDNPKRLEYIMCEILNLPNANKLIEDFRKSNIAKSSTKRTSTESDGVESKKKKGSETESYLKQIRDMFPDADGLFLISECQQLESWEDCSRFINTVMINGLYPKKGAVEYSSENDTPKIIEVIDRNNYRTPEMVSSEDEISTVFVDTPRKRRKRKNKFEDIDCQPSTSKAKEVSPTEIEVVDIASDNTESYDPPDEETLQEIYNNNKNVLVATPMEVDDVSEGKQNSWQTSLFEDVENLLEEKFGAHSIVKDDALNSSQTSTPKAGPSEVKIPTITINGSDDTPEKSEAEVIGVRRVNTLSPPNSVFSSNSLEPVEIIKVESNGSIYEVTRVMKNLKSESEETTFLEDEEINSKAAEEWLDEQTSNLIRIFPNTDPLFLREKVGQMERSLDAVNEFIITKLEKNDMPTRADYEKKMEMEELQNRYTKNFSIQEFLKILPEPWKYFTDMNRNCEKYKAHSLYYLKSAFRKHYVRDIIKLFKKNNHNLYVTYQEMKKMREKRRGNRRSEFECNHHRPTTIDIQYLQEVAFIENEDKIKEFIEAEKIARQIKFDEAKRTGSLLECQCCFDTEVLVEDIVYCPKDHSFCKDCITKCVEVQLGNGICRFECLTNCDEKFPLASLQGALKPELFSKVIRAIQMEEIKAAEIEDLVQCPFCNYATIMPPEEKVMSCLNPECLKESCRLCKELNHIPLRCDEVEKSGEVKLRTYIENKMTEALVRTCYKCGKKFVKEDGCNKMTCTCGAKMCYVCRKPVTGYSHFNGQGGTEFHKCPLYSTNDELHVDLVKRIAEEAKAEVLQANPEARLLHDPTMILPERTHERPVPGMRNGAAFNVGLRAIRGGLAHEEEEEDDDDDDSDDDIDDSDNDDDDDSDDEDDVEEEEEENGDVRRQRHHGHNNDDHHHHHHHHHVFYPIRMRLGYIRNWHIQNPYYNQHHHHHRYRNRNQRNNEEGNQNNHHHHHHHHHHLRLQQVRGRRQVEVNNQDQFRRRHNQH